MRYIPDSPLSKHEGMSTSCPRSCPNGGLSTAFKLEAFWYCQTPLRFCHCVRFNCGRGYSGHGSVPTLSVQGVSRGGCLGAYPAARTCLTDACFSAVPGRAKAEPARKETTAPRRCIVFKDCRHNEPWNGMYNLRLQPQMQEKKCKMSHHAGL